VGLSYNPYVWSEQIDPEAGVLRLVFGWGPGRSTVRRRLHPPGGAERAAAPPRRGTIRLPGLFTAPGGPPRPAGEPGSRRRGSTTWRASPPDLPIDLYAVRRNPLPRGEGASPRRPTKVGPSRSGNSCRRRRSSRTCGRCWGSSGRVRIPVDTEFTGNFLPDGRCLVNSCNAAAAGEGGGNIVDPPKRIPRGALLLESRGPIIGQSSLSRLDRVIFVDPAAYSALPQRAPSVGRLIAGSSISRERGDRNTLLLARGAGGRARRPSGAGLVRRDRQGVRDLRDHRVGMPVVPDVSLGDLTFSTTWWRRTCCTLRSTRRGAGFPEPDVPRGRPEPPRRPASGGRGVGGVVRVIDFPDAGDGRLPY